MSMALDDILESARRALTRSDKGKTTEEDREGDQRRPLLSLSPRQSFGPPPPLSSYGTVRPPREQISGSRSGSYLRAVAEEPEEVEGEDEIVAGTYARAVVIYSIVPFSLALVFLLLVIIPYALQQLALPSAHPPLLPYPLSSFLIPIALYSLSHVLREPVYSLLSLLLSSIYPSAAPALSTAIHVAVHTALRLFSVPLLFATTSSSVLHEAVGHPSHHNVVFSLVWYLSLGWGVAEVTASVAQGYTQLALYRDVFSAAAARDDISAAEADQFQVETDPLTLSGTISRERADQVTRIASPSALLEEELERLAALSGRQELEELYGVPLIRIPTFIQLLQRLAALLLSLGLTLVLSSAYLRWLGSFLPHFVGFVNTTQPKGATALSIALPVTFVLHLALAMLHTQPILAWVGAHAAAYAGVIVGLGALFAGLGMWEVLD